MSLQQIEVKEFPCNERDSFIYGCTLVDEDGVTPVQQSALQSLTLAVVDRDTGTVLRAAATVLTDLHVTSGRLETRINPADTAIVTSTKTIERHVGICQATWLSGGRRKNWQFYIDVRNLVVVT